MTKPYGYVRADGEGIFIYGEDKFQKIKDVVEFIPIYTEPPQRTWTGLTDEEMKQTCYEVCSYDPYTIAKAIEAKLKELNA
jgi:hypothetical protein